MSQAVIIDGQGGRMGAALVKRLREAYPEAELIAVGTNSIATAAMLKAGADCGATGENPVVRNVRDADVVLGPIGIVVADAILGEVTEKMAAAVGSCRAQKILLPFNSCSVTIAGSPNLSLSALVEEAVKEAGKYLA
ncbi:MAG: DUF3842 family protein [Oscillospiraceae bacterium]|nr:DUF3842 family protein [Oscillospiraceae bacterium]